ncbi:MAG: hypothetical protein ACR2P1_28595 [Pseudomonadales bacterium]
MTKIALFADVSPNLIDGSTIWLKNICLLIAHSLDDFQLDVFLRDDIENDVICSQIINIDSVNLIEPKSVNLLDSLQYESLPRDRLCHIVRLWEQKHGEYDFLLCRGYDFATEFANNLHIRKKLVVYWAYAQSYMNYNDDILLSLAKKHRIKVIAQTINVRRYLEVFGQLFSGDIYEIPPMVDASYYDHEEVILPAIQDGIRFSYCGKIDRSYCLMDLLSMIQQPWDDGSEYWVDICEGKLTHSSEEPSFLDSYSDVTESSLQGLSLVKNVAHSDVKTHMLKSNVGFCLRDTKFISSLELSTKMIEYCALSIPPLINLTEPHIEFFGEDYPLMLDYSMGSPDKINELFANLSQEDYDKARKQAVEVGCRFQSENYRSEVRKIFGKSAGAPGAGICKSMLIASHEYKFLDRLEEKLNASGLEISRDVWSTTKSPAVPREKFSWSGDVVFCEWCCEQAVWFSHNKQAGQKLVVRLHRFEMFTDFPSRVNWIEVDALIVVNESFRTQLLSDFEIPSEKVYVFPQFIESAQLDRRKHKSAEFSIGLVGINPYHHKRFDRALNFFEKLVEKDDRYILRVRSVMPWGVNWLWDHRLEEKALYEDLFEELINSKPALRSRIRFDEPGSDMEEWFRDVSYILSSSDTEGCHTSVLEGMASGCEPIVYNWPGAAQLFPVEYVYDNLDDAIDRILSQRMECRDGQFGKIFKDLVRKYDSSEFIRFLFKLTG